MRNTCRVMITFKPTFFKMKISTRWVAYGYVCLNLAGKDPQQVLDLRMGKGKIVAACYLNYAILIMLPQGFQ